MFNPVPQTCMVVATCPSPGARWAVLEGGVGAVVLPESKLLGVTWRGGGGWSTQGWPQATNALQPTGGAPNQAKVASGYQPTPEHILVQTSSSRNPQTGST